MHQKGTILEILKLTLATLHNFALLLFSKDNLCSKYNRSSKVNLCSEYNRSSKFNLCSRDSQSIKVNLFSKDNSSSKDNLSNKDNRSCSDNPSSQDNQSNKYNLSSKYSLHSKDNLSSRYNLFNKDNLPSKDTLRAIASQWLAPSSTTFLLLRPLHRALHLQTINSNIRSTDMCSSNSLPNINRHNAAVVLQEVAEVALKAVEVTFMATLPTIHKTLVRASMLIKVLHLDTMVPMVNRLLRHT